MKIIEKIEISYFRSFSKEVVITNCSDLNVLSGRNDSGKSNVLKALNLFFTDYKVDFYNELNFKNDFSRVRDRIAAEQKGKKLFKIKILFNRINFSEAVLPEKFYVEKVWDRDGDVTRKTKDSHGRIIKHNDSTVKVDSSTTSFLKKIHFLYIPAIKDYRFFDYLKTEYQNSLGTQISQLSNIDEEQQLTFNEWKDVLTSSDIINLLSEQINKEARNLMTTYLENTVEVENSSFVIPELDFSKVLEVDTDHGIPLTYRGDGVQTKFIPQMLNEISKNNSADLVIWAFEEPENSYEYANAQILAEKFKNDYSKDKQIFLTSHAFNFISLNSNNVSRYRVWKENFEDGTKIKYLNNLEVGDIDDDILYNELGVMLLNEHLDNLYQELETKRAHINATIETLEEEIEQIHKPIIISEGNNKTYIEIAKQYYLPTLDFEILDQRELGDKEIEKLFKFLLKTQNKAPKKMFILDCDSTKVYETLNNLQTEFLIPYIFNNNTSNDKVKKGIENLFDKELFEDEFYDIRVNDDDYGGKTEVKKFNKAKFEEHITENHTLSIFSNFRHLFDEYTATNNLDSNSESLYS